MISTKLFQRLYGDPKYRYTDRFFAMVRDAVDAQSRVLNLGAGPATGNNTCSLRGEVAEVVGADIDPAVLTNSEVDRAVVTDGVNLPFPDADFDAAFSDYVLEHVELPVLFLAEVHRVLRSGGTYFFRTPNIFHYVALGSRLTPHWVHTLIANRMRGLPQDAHEPWPTYYRLNCRRAIRRAAVKAGFRKIDFVMVEGHPSYLMFHIVPFMAGLAYERLVNSTELLAGLRANIFGRLVK
jgi:SAM-dependent methyltransferase